MKKIKLFFVSVSLIGLLASCGEVNDLVNLTPPKGAYDQLILDTTIIGTSIPGAQSKNVLIEDFTGVRCDNCPRAQARGITIEKANPGRVSVLGIQCYPGLEDPYIKSFDLRTAYGDKLLALQGAPGGLPIGDIDRKVYKANPNSFLSDFLWSGTTATELTMPTVANIDFVNKSYDPASRIFSIKANVSFTKSVPDTFYFSTAITESGFKGLQLTTSDIDSHFVFQHVLRNMMSPWNGLKIATNPVAGQTCSVKFSTILPNNWVADSCKVVSFVHHLGYKNDVEQVMETTIK